MPVVKYNDPQVIDDLVEAFTKGASITIATGYAGIDKDTFFGWQNRAKEGEEPFVSIIDRIKRSKHAADLKRLEKIEEALDKGTWQAGAWKLERIYPHDYGNNPALIDLNRRLASLEKGNPDEQKADEKTSTKT